MNSSDAVGVARAVPMPNANREDEIPLPLQRRVEDLLRAASEFWRLDRAFRSGVQPLKDHRGGLRGAFLRRAMPRGTFSHPRKSRRQMDTATVERRHILFLDVLTAASFSTSFLRSLRCLSNISG
jgi:hypothetical protein